MCVGAVVMATGHAVCRFVQIVDLLIITLMILTCIKKATLRVSSSLSLSLSLAPFIQFCEQRSFMPVARPRPL